MRAILTRGLVALNNCIILSSRFVWRALSIRILEHTDESLDNVIAHVVNVWIYSIESERVLERELVGVWNGHSKFRLRFKRGYCNAGIAERRIAELMRFCDTSNLRELNLC